MTAQAADFHPVGKTHIAVYFGFCCKFVVLFVFIMGDILPGIVSETDLDDVMFPFFSAFEDDLFADCRIIRLYFQDAVLGIARVYGI